MRPVSSSLARPSAALAARLHSWLAFVLRSPWSPGWRYSERWQPLASAPRRRWRMRPRVPTSARRPRFQRFGPTTRPQRRESLEPQYTHKAARDEKPDLPYHRRHRGGWQGNGARTREEGLHRRRRSAKREEGRGAQEGERDVDREYELRLPRGRPGVTLASASVGADVP